MIVSECISAVCVLAVISVGVLIITQVITVEQAMKFAAHVVLVLVGTLFASCLLKIVLQTVLIPLLTALKVLLLWLLVAVGVIAALALAAKGIAFKLQRKFGPTSDSGR